MPMRTRRHLYPPDWDAIATAIKTLAGWRCQRCAAPHAPETGYTLTVHHIDGDPQHNTPENLVALCQRCHLQIQGWLLPGQLPLPEFPLPAWAAHFLNLPETPMPTPNLLAQATLDLHTWLAAGQAAPAPLTCNSLAQAGAAFLAGDWLASEWQVLSALTCARALHASADPARILVALSDDWPAVLLLSAPELHLVLTAQARVLLARLIAWTRLLSEVAVLPAFVAGAHRRYPHSRAPLAYPPGQAAWPGAGR